MLSGGERNRYALARILVSPSNFLLLDEPTNHLDMRAKDVLLEAIASFSGTVVFVSHDRYFIDRLATRVLEVENGAVTTYEGNYEDYLRRKEAQAASAIQQLRCPNPFRASFSRRKGPSPSQFHRTRRNRIRSRRRGTPSCNAEQPSSSKVATIRQRKTAPPESHQAEADGRPLRLSRGRSPARRSSSIAHTEQQLGVYVSAAETERLTHWPRISARS